MNCTYLCGPIFEFGRDARVVSLAARKRRIAGLPWGGVRPAR